MDSFVLAETFKYLYLLFAEEEDLVLDMDDFVFNTEAHIFPLTLANSDRPSVSHIRVSYRVFGWGGGGKCF